MWVVTATRHRRGRGRCIPAAWRPRGRRLHAQPRM